MDYGSQRILDETLKKDSSFTGKGLFGLPIKGYKDKRYGYESGAEVYFELGVQRGDSLRQNIPVVENNTLEATSLCRLLGHFGVTFSYYEALGGLRFSCDPQKIHKLREFLRKCKKEGFIFEDNNEITRREQNENRF